MAKPSYFRWNPSETEADEDWRKMDVSQRGLFMTLLNHGWDNRGLPIDPLDIWRVISLKIDRKSFEKLWSGLIESKFPVVGDRRMNQRQEWELSLAQEVSNKRAEAARVKHKKSLDVGSANAEHVQDFAEQNHLYSTSNSNSDLKSSSRKGSAEGKPKRQSDDFATVVARLAGNPAWKGIDVAIEAAKCAAWCQVNVKPASERRLVNWLNRVERPLLNGHVPVRTGPRDRRAEASEEFDRLMLEEIEKNARKVH